WHELALVGRFGESATWQGGIYENDYVLEDGIWKIARLRYFPQYAGDYDAFGHQAPARWEVPYHFEAQQVGVTVPEAALQAMMRSTAATSPPQLAQRLQRLHDETAVQNLQHALG